MFSQIGLKMEDHLTRLERLVSDRAVQSPPERRSRGVWSDEWRTLGEWRPEIEALLADGWRLKSIAAVLPTVAGVSVSYDSIGRFLRRAWRDATALRAPDPEKLARFEQAAATHGGKSPKSVAGVVRRYADEIRALLRRGYDPEAIAAALAEDTGLRIDKYWMMRLLGDGRRAPPLARRSPRSDAGGLFGPGTETSTGDGAARESATPSVGASVSAALFASVGPAPSLAGGTLDAEMEEIKRRLDEKLASDPARQPSEQTKAFLAEIEKMTGDTKR